MVSQELAVRSFIQVVQPNVSSAVHNRKGQARPTPASVAAAPTVAGDGGSPAPPTAPPSASGRRMPPEPVPPSGEPSCDSAGPPTGRPPTPAPPPAAA